MNALTLVANQNKTDKGTIFGECHSFTEIYEKYINKYMGKSPKILEIGVDQGSSLKMWNEYFHGNCEIYAIDIIEGKKQFETDNTHIYILDQSSREMWKTFKNSFENNCKEYFDIIIDDGSHIAEHQIITLSELSNCVKKDGIYILEDLHCNIVDLDCYNKNTDFKDRPLFSLMFKEKNKFLSDKENDFLMQKLKNITIYSLDNPNGGFKNRSITSIINFN